MGAEDARALLLSPQELVALLEASSMVVSMADIDRTALEHARAKLAAELRREWSGPTAAGAPPSYPRWAQN